jgi:predicted MPP superfamily phosphohydrolase
MYELSWGYRKIGNTHFFVSSGLRLWGPPVKTAGKSEIMLVDFIFE